MNDRNLPESDYDLTLKSTLDLRGRMLSNTGLLGGSRILAALMGVVTLIITARVLSDNVAFGTLLFIHAYMLFFAEIVSFQIWQALIRFGSDELKANNGNRLGALIKTGLVIDFIAAFVAFGLAIGLFGVFLWARSLIGYDAPPDSKVIDPQALKTMIIAYCSVILFRQTNVAVGVFRLFDKFLALAARALVMPAIRLIGVLIASTQGWGLREFLMIWFVASLAGYLVLQIFAILELANRRLWPVIRKATLCRTAEFPQLYPFLLKTNIDSTLNSLKLNFPSLAVMLVFGPVLFAVYKIAEEISRLLLRGIALFDQVLFPELSRMAADLDLKALTKTTAKAALGIGVAGFLLSAIVLIFGVDLVKTAFDDSFENAPLLAVMLLVSTSLIGIATPFYSAFYVLMRPGAAIWVRVTGTLSFIILFFVLAERFGLFSIGWAAIIGAAIEVILVIALTSWLIKKAAKLPQK